MYFPKQEYIDDSIDQNNPDLLRIHSLETLGTHDGPGIRMVVFAQGCQFRCLYCQNPDTLDIHGGSFVPIEELVEKALHQKSYFGKQNSCYCPYFFSYESYPPGSYQRPIHQQGHRC